MRSRLDPVAAVLALLAVALAALLWQAGTLPIDRRPVVDAALGDAPGADASITVRPARPGALSSYSETLTRPLLEPTRRPAVAAPVEAPSRAAQPAPLAAAPPSVTGLKLLGIVKADRGAARALIRAADGEAGQWVTEGGQLGRWRIEKISDATVVLEAQGSRVELAMFAAPRPLSKR